MEVFPFVKLGRARQIPTSSANILEIAREFRTGLIALISIQPRDFPPRSFRMWEKLGRNFPPLFQFSS
jgi:hypothetical protein